MQKDFILKVKALDSNTGAFTGLASTYGDPPDLHGDVIELGAFRQSIAVQGKGYPLLWAHNQAEPLGLARISNSADGLMVDGSLLLDDPAAKRAQLHLKAGSIKAMSIGYTLPTDAGKVMYRDDGARVLKEVRIHEISLVAVPANPAALIQSVKSLSQVQDLLRTYKPDALQGDDRAALTNIFAELKRLMGRKSSLCECDCLECLAGDCIDCSDASCADPNCDANIAAKAETAAAIKAFGLSLKDLLQ